MAVGVADVSIALNHARPSGLRQGRLLPVVRRWGNRSKPGRMRVRWSRGWYGRQTTRRARHARLRVDMKRRSFLRAAAVPVLCAPARLSRQWASATVESKVVAGKPAADTGSGRQVA